MIETIQSWFGHVGKGVALIAIILIVGFAFLQVRYHASGRKKSSGGSQSPDNPAGEA